MKTVLSKLTQKQIEACTRYNFLQWQYKREGNNCSAATYKCTLAGYLQALADVGQINAGDKLKLYIHFTAKNIIENT